jgi:hypothetical protein
MNSGSMLRTVAVFAGTLAFVMSVQIAGATHPRPKKATPMVMALVPAHQECAAPNRTHGPSLAFPSCNPPAQTSARATVGTPDAFGGPSNSISHVRLSYAPCLGHCFDEDDDIRIEIALNDVRCVPTGGRCGAANAGGPADYVGEMRLSFAVRLTDHNNGTSPPPSGGTEAATVEDFTIDHALVTSWGTALTWACVQSSSTSIGSTCNVNTALDAFMPASGTYGSKRSIWELHDVRIYDGGADGDGHTTADNTVFVRPGVFVP